ncbi:hypothetical protein LP415_26185 [Polaromonas sp. P1(28)-8]|nr:hypothetical protein LP415_26185 [Polaromonas sp. P1(28)-8]
MGEKELPGMAPVTCHQQPARQALRYRVVVQAGRLLCHEACKNVDVAVQDSAQAGIFSAPQPQCITVDLEGPPCALHQTGKRRNFHAKRQRGVAHALVAHQGNAKARGVGLFHRQDDRHKAFHRKVGVLGQLASFCQHGLGFEFHQFAMFDKHRAFVRRQC